MTCQNVERSARIDEISPKWSRMKVVGNKLQSWHKVALTRTNRPLAHVPRIIVMNSSGKQ